MKQEEILFFLGSVVIVVFAWIAFTLLHNSLTSTISAGANQAILPIQSSFDTKEIDAMKKRTVIVPLTTINPSTPKEIVVTSSPVQPVASESGSTSEGGNAQ